MSLRASLRALALAIQLVAGAVIPRGPVPTIDLGYVVHQPSYEGESDLYFFNNIRYGKAPTGDLRWKAPVPPETNRNVVVDGPGNICPQSFPEWTLTLKAGQLNITTDELASSLMNNPLMSEDCLFARVVVPADVLHETAYCQAKKKPGKVPVMVWIHGGGYVSGSNDDDQFYPAGLINASRIHNDGEPIVFVSLNYRLGAFGWLNAGEADGDVLANAALHDQRLGLDWVKENIASFGGDPDRITVFGESAGGGSIMHHLTAYGGEEEPKRDSHGHSNKLPFQRALMQSPGWTPTNNTPQGWLKLLAAASEITRTTISDAAGLRSLTSEQLTAANQAVVYESSWGGFTYGPSVDGVYVPDMVGRLLLEDRFVKGVDVMVGHNMNESVIFTPPTFSAAVTAQQFGEAAYGVSAANRDHVMEVLYPPVYDGTYGYETEFARAVLMTSEWAFNCNTRWLGVAYGGGARNYRFDIEPGWHGQDVRYTFWNGEGRRDGIVPRVAQAMQAAFVTFAKDGTPVVPGLKEEWPYYTSGNGNTILSFAYRRPAIRNDTLMNDRCEYFQPGDYQDLV